MVILAGLSIISMFVLCLHLLAQIRLLLDIVKLLSSQIAQSTCLDKCTEEARGCDQTDWSHWNSGGIITKPTRLLEAGRRIDPPPIKKDSTSGNQANGKC